VIQTALRTNSCGELTVKNEGNVVTISGWVHSYRDHGGVLFIDLRDKYGITQVVFEPTNSPEIMEEASTIRREWSIQVKGAIRQRAEGMANDKLATGGIELLANELVVFNESKVPPFEIDDRIKINEDVRYKYRYLDLRRPGMLKKMQFRSKAAQVIRNFLVSDDFMEIETPLLVRSTPEGARDFVVPSRTHQGTFYALPQSPQLYKQILMVAGMDRYFQIARCLRDEDLRQDRQPEHTQIDLEMSYVDTADIHRVVEGMLNKLFKDMLNIDLPESFQQMSYKDAILYYGTDKPDLRFDMKITDVTDIVKESDFSVFKAVAGSGGKIRCIAPKAEFSRKDLDDNIKFAQKCGAKGMAWMRVTENGLESNIVKFFSEDIQKQLLEVTNAEVGSVLMFIADKEKMTASVLGRLRNKIGAEKEFIKDKTEFKLLWIIDFPLFETNSDGILEPAHHMFTMPNKEWLDKINTGGEDITCTQFDLVMNGVELGSGSVRINDPKVQKAVMDVVGFDEKMAEERFGFLLEAMKYGAPPHGGCGIGFDRLLTLMLGESDIREVIAFPKTSTASSLLDGAPSEIGIEQIMELSLKVLKKDKQ